jgi:AraC-like DNA-binding protein
VLLGTTSLQELAGAAVDGGYADQSHLTREVRSLRGLTPTRLFDDRRIADE